MLLRRAISLAPPSHRTSIALNFHRTEALSYPFPVILRRTPSVSLARVAPFRTLMCVSLFDLVTGACSSPCVAAFLSSILPQLCRTENQDAIDAAIVGILADPKEARAGIREIQQRCSLADIEPLQLQRGCEEEGYATIVKIAERGLRSLGVARQEVPEKSKDAPGAPWQFVALLPLFDPPRHDSAETITRALNLGVNVKMITGDQLAIAKETGRRLGMGTNMMLGTWVLWVLKVPHRVIPNNGIRAWLSAPWKGLPIGWIKGRCIVRDLGIMGAQSPTSSSMGCLIYLTQDKFGVRSLRHSPAEMMAALYLQRNLHGLQPPETTNLFNDKYSYRELSEIAEQAKRRAEVASKASEAVEHHYVNASDLNLLEAHEAEASLAGRVLTLLW
ncbi:hypothetical protein AHAS_Ahas13G0290300 [Arachis hypogaea]